VRIPLAEVRWLPFIAATHKSLHWHCHSARFHNN